MGVAAVALGAAIQNLIVPRTVRTTMEGHKHDASHGDERPLGFGPGSWPRSFTLITVAVGTTIADRPPHRSVQARLRIRLLSWMSGGKAGIRIRMQNTGLRNPPVQERDETIPAHLSALTATDQNAPPQSANATIKDA